MTSKANTILDISYASEFTDQPPFADMDYAQYAIPFQLSQLLLRSVIGSKGSHFIRITEDCNAKYIWYVREKNVIEIWAESLYIIEKVKASLEEHIKKLIEKHPKLCTKKMLKWASTTTTTPPDKASSSTTRTGVQHQPIMNE